MISLAHVRALAVECFAYDGPREVRGCSSLADATADSSQSTVAAFVGARVFWAIEVRCCGFRRLCGPPQTPLKTHASGTQPCSKTCSVLAG